MKRTVKLEESTKVSGENNNDISESNNASGGNGIAPVHYYNYQNLIKIFR